MKNYHKIKRAKRQRRAARTRAKIFGTDKKPRLAVFRSNKNIYAQLINDIKGKTLVSVNSRQLERGKNKRTELAQAIGRQIAQKAWRSKLKRSFLIKAATAITGLLNPWLTVPAPED